MVKNFYRSLYNGGCVKELITEEKLNKLIKFLEEDFIIDKPIKKYK